MLKGRLSFDPSQHLVEAVNQFHTDLLPLAHVCVALATKARLKPWAWKWASSTPESVAVRYGIVIAVNYDWDRMTDMRLADFSCRSQDG